MRPTCQYGWTIPVFAAMTVASRVCSMQTVALTPLPLPGLGRSRESRIELGVITLDASLNDRRDKLVNSSFIVRTTKYSDIDRCAHVVFDGNGNVTIDSKCICDGNATCTDFTLDDLNGGTACGNELCEVQFNETPQTCPVDCPLVPAECGNTLCEIGETRASCPADCDGSAPL